MLTGVSNLSDGPLGLGMGADEYLVKPFDPAEMVARADNLLRKLRKIAEETATNESVVDL
jgi:DNA-binding response OmpR family regulator